MEEELYSIALEEVEKSIMKRGTWSKALANTNSYDEAVRFYIRKRVEKLSRK